VREPASGFWISGLRTRPDFSSRNQFPSGSGRGDEGTPPHPSRGTRALGPGSQRALYPLVVSSHEIDAFEKAVIAQGPQGAVLVGASISPDGRYGAALTLLPSAATTSWTTCSSALATRGKRTAAEMLVSVGHRSMTRTRPASCVTETERPRKRQPLGSVTRAVTLEFQLGTDTSRSSLGKHGSARTQASSDSSSTCGRHLPPRGALGRGLTRGAPSPSPHMALRGLIAGRSRRA
jgi:hypothetical protein